MLLALLLSAPASALDGYKAAKWGMTEAQVTAVVPGLGSCTASSATGTTRCVPLDILGRPGTIVYQFRDGKLFAVNLVFERPDPALYGELLTLLEEKYGEPQEMAQVTGAGSVVSARWATHAVELRQSTADAVLLVAYTSEAAAKAEAAKAAL